MGYHDELLNAEKEDREKRETSMVDQLISKIKTLVLKLPANHPVAKELRKSLQRLENSKESQ